MKPAYRRELVKHLQVVWGVSMRRACAIVGGSRFGLYYRHKRDTQAVLRQRIREIAETRVKWGYRRIHVLLRREGWRVNAKRVHRLYCLEGLQLRNKTPKRKVSAKLRSARTLAKRQNEIWAMDFVSDQLFDGTKLRILTIVDVFTRFSPAIDARKNYRADDVVNTLERVTRTYGVPKEIRVDNGPEFISRALDLWAYMNGVKLDFSRPGKPTDNAFVESFNGKFRAECLNTAWFLSQVEAQAKCEAWRRDYNEVRPHSSIGHQTPAELIFASGQACLA
ncbi:MAG: transposase [Desulfovibrionaceae bacterium CG1_02_65_16]|nr:MAG: transposase [Desulfovibrionaceae bacterium CG1_02_65_16]